MYRVQAREGRRPPSGAAYHACTTAVFAGRRLGHAPRRGPAARPQSNDAANLTVARPTWCDQGRPRMVVARTVLDALKEQRD